MSKRIFTTPGGNVEVNWCGAGPHSDRYPSQDFGWCEKPDGSREPVTYLRGIWMTDAERARVAQMMFAPKSSFSG